MEEWYLKNKTGDFFEMGKRNRISPVLAKLLVNRDVAEKDFESFLHGTIEMLADPFLMKDMDKLIGKLKEKLAGAIRIRIIGDYDIDGVCSAYILEKVLKNCRKYLNPDCDLSLIDTVLPNRITDGYGLNRRLIDEAHDAGVDTIITCDNGISAGDEISYAKELGMTVLITDHHEVPYHVEDGKKVYELPMADAIVNPKQPDCLYPFKMLCGAAICYRVSQALYSEVCTEADMQEFLDAAAFATIGDVMPLIGENRIIVKEGLKRLKNTGNPGFRALIELCGLSDRDELSVYHVGFVLGPCLNAAGRLEDASIAHRLLMSSGREAFSLAEKLMELNELRKRMTEESVEEGIRYIESLHKKPKVFVVYLPNAHESIAGIIAGRIREKYNHPVFVLTRTADGVKGSGRSIDKYDMYGEMIKIREIFSKFGGHTLAAGLSIPAESDEERILKVKEFSDMLNANAVLEEKDFAVKVSLDMELSFEWLKKDLVEELNLLEPCGTGNKKPLFGARNVQLYNGRIIGKNKNVFRAVGKDGSGLSRELIMFGQEEELREKILHKNNAVLAYVPEINEYNGNVSVQLRIANIK